MTRVLGGTLIGLTLAAGCGVDARYSTLESKIFALNCTTASCHGAGASGGLNLTAGKGYAALVGVTPQNAAAASEGLLRVKPGDLDRSFLVLKLREGLDARYGSRMPVTHVLDSASRTAIELWVASGAAND